LMDTKPVRKRTRRMMGRMVARTVDASPWHWS
jgi:hypothetical protein